MYGCFGTFTDRSPHTAITPCGCKPVGNASETLSQLPYSMCICDFTVGTLSFTGVNIWRRPYEYGSHMQVYISKRGATAATVWRSLSPAKAVPRSLPRAQVPDRARGRWAAAGVSLPIRARQRPLGQGARTSPRACAWAPRRAAGTVGSAAIAPKRTMPATPANSSSLHTILCDASQWT